MSRKQILICDDNQDTLLVLGRCLREKLNADVILLNSGRGVIHYLQNNLVFPDLLVLDLMLPDLEGDDIIQKLRTDVRFQHINMLLMSGIIVNVDNRAKAVGADGFLKKPFSLKEFQDKVSAMLEEA